MASCVRRISNAQDSQFDPSKHLRREDILFFTDWTSTINRWSKTIQFGQRFLTVPLPRIAHRPLCPYTALRHAFLLVPAPLLGPASIPASTEEGLTALTYGKFDSLLKLLAAKTNIDPSQVSGHSFRSGGATLAFQAQIPAELIKRLGDCWQSDAYRSYIHVPVKDRMHAVERLASCVWIFPSWRLFRLGLGGAFLGQMLLNGRVHFGALPCLLQT